MAIYNKINGENVTPMGKQKKYLLNLKNTERCEIYGLSYNGYGYEDHVRNYTLSEAEYNEYLSLAPEPKKNKKEKTQDDIINAWAKRLVLLSPKDTLTIDDAIDIAHEKLNYQREQIYELESRGYSKKRQQLIDKISRSNPLRRITDSEHAYAVIAASNRHTNTDYEYRLDEARELAAVGVIDRCDVKQYARANTNANNF